MSVAMALAEARHYTAPRGQMTASAEATNDTSKERVAGEDTAGLRPGPVLDPRRQRGTAGTGFAAHFGARRRRLPFVQIIDVLLPKMGNQLLEIMQAPRHRRARAGY